MSTQVADIEVKTSKEVAIMAVDTKLNTNTNGTSSSLKRTSTASFSDISDAKRFCMVPSRKGKRLLKSVPVPSLNQLPDEILLQIFQNLDTVNLMDVALTSERLFRICWDKSLWKVIKIYDVDLKEGILEQYLSFAGPHTEEIYIIGFEQRMKIIGFADLYLMKAKCPQLRVLHLVNQTLDAMELFITALPSSIIELSFANTAFINRRFIKRFLNGFDTYFADLQTLILSECKWFAPHSIMLVSKLPNLKKLLLDGCTQLRDFMPYLSLSTRYGFQALEEIDLRYTFVSDSDVSCFVSTKTLKDLKLKFVSRPDSPPLPDPSRVVNYIPTTSQLTELHYDIVHLELLLEGNYSPTGITLRLNIQTLKAAVDETIVADIHDVYKNIQNLRLLIDMERCITPDYIRCRYREQTRFSRCFEDESCDNEDDDPFPPEWLNAFPNMSPSNEEHWIEEGDRESERPSTSGLSTNNPTRLAKRLWKSSLCHRFNWSSGPKFKRQRYRRVEDDGDITYPGPIFYTIKKLVHETLGTVPIKDEFMENRTKGTSSDTSGETSSQADKTLSDEKSTKIETAQSQAGPSTSTQNTINSDSSASSVAEILARKTTRTFEIATYPIGAAGASNAQDPYKHEPTFINIEHGGSRLELNNDIPSQIRSRINQAANPDVRCRVRPEPPPAHLNDPRHLADVAAGRNHVIVVISRDRPNPEVQGHVQDLQTDLMDNEVSTVGNRTVHALFNSRAECVSLERVSFNGYANITDVSLNYLSASPHVLTFLDVRGTNVTECGCINFKIRRPECELRCDFDID